MISEALVYGDVFLEGFEGAKIEDFSLLEAINDHAGIELKLLLVDDVRQEVINKIKLQEQIVIRVREDRLFSGIIDNFHVHYESDVCIVTLKAYSHTKKMDEEKKTRSFQNTQMTYESLFKRIAKDYEKGSCIDQITMGKTTGHPIIQYKETDFEFIKRMASVFNAPIVPYLRNDHISFYIGVKESSEVLEKHKGYRIKRDNHRFHAMKKLYEDVIEADFDLYYVHTEEIYDLGTQIQFDNRRLYVLENHIRYENALMEITTVLGSEKSMKVETLYNPLLNGVSLEGKVLAVIQDKVKVQFDFDEVQEVATAYPYPFATMYASGNETGFYFMPEKGDRVRIYHHDMKEGSGVVLSMPRTYEAGVKEDPSIKYLRSPGGKEVRLRPSGIDIISKGGQVYMTLNDDGNIYLSSNSAISFSAENEIDIKSKVINMKAVDNIELTSGDNTMNVKDHLEVNSKKVNVN